MIELRTLGQVELNDAGNLPIASQRKRLALLTYLALAGKGGFRRRDAILALLWPELDDAHARGALRQGLHFLRRLLGENAIVTRGESEVGLNSDALTCDALEFNARHRAGQHASALQIYRGDFLEGFSAPDVSAEFEQWVENQRFAIREAASSSAWSLAEEKRRIGQIDSAASLARRAASLAPTDEAASARLIDFLDTLGDRGGALSVHDDLVSRLRSEYDTVPSPETRALVDRIRNRTVPSPLTGQRDQSVLLPAQAMRQSGETHPVVIPAEKSFSGKYFRVGMPLVVAIIVGVMAARFPPGRDRVQSVAVIPLEDLGMDSTQAYVAEGITEQLITDLAQTGSLQVINRRTMSAYRNSRQTPAQIARDLHADAVVSGTIQNFGDTVHMTAQLVLAGDDRAVWAQTFEGTRGDLLRMQREAARALTKQMKLAVTPSSRPLLAARGMDPEALDLYIRGRYYWNKRGPGLLKSIDFFSRALDIDPQFALAWSGMADAYVQLGYGSLLAPSDAFPKARAAANRARALDSTMAEPHSTLAFVSFYYDWNWKSAEAEFKRAIQLNPSYATAHEWYGLYLAAMGRFDEARAEEGRAQELDPLSTAISGTAGWILYYAGRNDEAARALDIVLRQDSVFPLGHLYRGRVYEAAGDNANALTQYAASGPLKAWVPTIAAEGHVYGILKRTQAARMVLARLDTLSHKQYVTAYGIALVHAGLQQNDSAFSWLNRGLEERSHWMVWLNRDPRWNSLRGDPRFAALTRKMSLPK